ncbi:MAG: RNA polymerase sigma factor [Oscillospiraceae bacterium]|nr:RNA polymerase sigma factor [Oscillospiraceae bacterium]
MKTDPKPELSRELIHKAQNGDQGAMTALYEATHQEVYRTVHAMVRDEDLTLDIQQDAYVQAFSHLDQLWEPENFLPWLRQIAVNRTRSLMRKRTPLLFSQLELGDAYEGLEIPDLSPENSPELALDRKETNRLIREILGELSDAQRMLVGMYYYEQIPVGKIAEDLGISPGSVKTQLFRSRKKLESRIRQLESQGVKLFGLSPMPFLLGLLKKAEPPAAAEGKALAGVLTQSAASTASTAVKAVAVHTGRSFFQTALGRVTLGVLAAAALGGGVLGYGRIKDKLLIGDYQPPSPTDSEETLDTDVPEDLTTELILITETETLAPTEPVVTTEPEIETGTREPENQAPIDPEPKPAGTVEGGSQPGPVVVLPEETTVRTVETEAKTDQHSEILSWRWVDDMPMPSGMDWTVDHSIFTRKGRRLVIKVSGSQIPEVYCDRSDVLRVDYWGQFTGLTTDWKPTEGIMEYQWLVNTAGVGTARISCSMNGVSFASLTVQVPEYPIRYDGTHASSYTSPVNKDQDLGNCYVGTEFSLTSTSYGAEAPELSIDNPQVAVMKKTGTGIVQWNQSSVCVTIEIIGAGDANLYVKLKGEVQEIIPIHAEVYEKDPNDTQEDLLPAP